MVGRFACEEAQNASKVRVTIQSDQPTDRERIKLFIHTGTTFIHRQQKMPAFHPATMVLVFLIKLLVLL